MRLIEGTAAVRRDTTPAIRVLVDLSHAADGYVGVAQDLRLVFNTLCGLDKVDVAGLLMPAARHDLPRIRPGAADHAALAAGVLHWMERNWEQTPWRPFPLSLPQMAKAAWHVARTRHYMLSLDDGSQLNAIWRMLFARTLPPDQRARVLARQFYATDLSVSNIIDRCVHLPVTLPKRLAAHGFDAVVFPMPRPVRLPPGVRQVVRCHDTVPVTDVDTVPNWRIALAQSRLVKACAPDALFVCNSPQTLDHLIGLDPKREKHAVVIPCTIPPAAKAPAGLRAADVIGRHVSFRALGRGDAAPDGWARPEPGMRYVLAVSTLEPRKNFVGLVRAWERVVARRDPNLRLVIVGGPGWQEEPILAAMRQGVASGRLYHVQNVPAEDLSCLMAGAAAFAAVSFNEGFGFTPLEAAQAGAPCLVADLPVFRWALGDAAVYADPYDIESIATGIERLTCMPESPDLVRRLSNRAVSVLARFRPEVAAEGWRMMLEGLRRPG